MSAISFSSGRWVWCITILAICVINTTHPTHQATRSMHLPFTRHSLPSTLTLFLMFYRIPPLLILPYLPYPSFSTLPTLPYTSQHLSEEMVHQIIGEAVEVEKAFICDALPVSLIGMNSDLMREYIEYCADRLVQVMSWVLSQFQLPFLSHCTVQFRIVQFRTALYCTVLYCTVLYCTVLYCTVLLLNSLPLTVELNITATHFLFLFCRLIVSLGHGKKYHVSNPFPWMDLISLEGKTNFFERRVGEYQKANVMLSSASSDSNTSESDAGNSDTSSGRNRLNLDADFWAAICLFHSSPLLVFVFCSAYAIHPSHLLHVGIPLDLHLHLSSLVSSSPSSPILYSILLSSPLLSVPFLCFIKSSW